MNCRTIREMLVEYADGEATQSVRATVESHVADCASCQRELDELRALLHRCREDRVPDPGQAFWAAFPHQVMQAVHAEAKQHRPSTPARLRDRLQSLWPLPRNTSFAYAITAAMVIGVIGLFLLSQDTDPLDSYHFQAQFSNAKQLAQIATNNAIEPPSQNVYGFSESAMPNLFVVGTIYSQSLTSALGGDSSTTIARLRHIERLLEPLKDTALAREIQDVSIHLSDPNQQRLAIKQLAELQQTLAATATARGERERVLFEAGRVVMDLRLAALARDPQLAAGARMIDTLADDMRKAGLARGAIEAASEIQALLEQGPLSDKANRDALQLLDRIQTSLM